MTPRPPSPKQLADELDLLGAKAHTLALELRATPPGDHTYVERTMRYLEELHSTVRNAVEPSADERARWSRA